MMRKVLVFQHVAYEILGTLNPLLKKKGFRVRYINFDRQPDLLPSIERYNGLVILGGHMGVYETDRYPHLRAEMAAIEQALKKDIPILGICLGSQLLAHVLGAEVRPSPRKEFGWHDVEFTAAGRSDPLFAHFAEREKVFQLHGDTFAIPEGARHLARSERCAGQAFRFGEKAYGIQFHLEVDHAMITRWMKVPRNLKDLADTHGEFSVEQILTDTERHIAQSVAQSRKTFLAFIKTFGLADRPELLGTDHAKPPPRDD